MGLFDFLKNVIQQNTTSSTHGDSGAQTNLRNFQKDEAGLYPHEILLLSYYEKYAAGKEVARFWEREYGVDNVPALMTSLESRGFAENGKLTESGKREIEKNEYVMYMHRHKFPNISMTDMSILVNKNPGRPYRDLLWAEFNRLSLEYMKSGNIGLYRNSELSMYQFLTEEKRHGDAFDHLALVMFYDLNGDESPSVAPRIIEWLKESEKHTNYTDKEIAARLINIFSGLYAPNRNYSSDEVISIIVAYCYGNDEMAEDIFKRGKERIRPKQPTQFKPTLSASKRKKIHVRIK